MGVLNKFFGRFKVNQDPSVTTQVSSIIQAASGSLVLAPEGTGAIIANIPDGTTVGGNARGNNSIDLQTYRTNANQIAEGGFYNAILSGQRNRVSTIVGTGSSIVSGGDSNTVTSNRGTISGGGNSLVSSDFGTISGGQQNTASTNSHATVVGGYLNTASGQYSVAGGRVSTASAQDSVVFGRQHSVTGIGAFSIGGYNNTVSGYRAGAFGSYNDVSSVYGLILGHYSNSYLYGQIGIANGSFGNAKGDGDAQQSLLTSRKQDTLSSAATTVLSLDGTGTSGLIIPNGNNRAWNVQVKTVAVVTAITGTATGVSVGDTLMQDDKLLFSKVSGVSSVVGTTAQDFISSTSLSTSGMSYSAGASQELALTFTAPTFTGGGTVTMRVVSKVELVEVAF